MRLIFRLRLLRALSHRPVFVLWSGQAFSAIGDEVYKVALIWLAVGMVGEDAGYLASAQAGSVLLFGLLGGIWADRWDPRRTMLRVDVIRGVIVFIPVIWNIFAPLSLPVLVFVAIAASALSSFFEPALQASIPRLARGAELLQATNGLMGTTSRLARAVGPSIVGVMTSFLPMVHFFTLDAASFAVSAYAISSLKRHLPDERGVKPKRIGVGENLASAYRLVGGDPVIRFVLVAKAICSGAWSVVLPLGIALLVQKMLPGNVRAYGFLLATYGVGNVAGALVLANISMRRPLRMMGLGFSLMGASFVLMAMAPSLYLMMPLMAAAAVGGPMNDLAHIDLFQRRFPPSQLARIVRFRMAIEYGGMCLCLAAGPTLFKWLDPQRVIVLAGLAIFGVGATALIRYGESAVDAELPAAFGT